MTILTSSVAVATVCGEPTLGLSLVMHKMGMRVSHPSSGGDFEKQRTLLTGMHKELQDPTGTHKRARSLLAWREKSLASLGTALQRAEGGGQQRI